MLIASAKILAGKRSWPSIRLLPHHTTPHRTVSVGVLNLIPKLYDPTDSEHKFHKTGIENWLRIGFNLALITTALCSAINRESLKVLHTHP